MVDGVEQSQLYDCFALAIKDALEVINQMQADGVISKYAIGGAVGATFYIEAAATVDLDIFVDLSSPTGSSLVSLSPIYEFLSLRGFKAEREFIRIGNWPVQFLPTSNDLEREALDEAVEVKVKGVKTRAMRPEHLIALAVRTGRPKDHARIAEFQQRKVFDTAKLQSVLERHGLWEKWQKLIRPE